MAPAPLALLLMLCSSVCASCQPSAAAAPLAAAAGNATNGRAVYSDPERGHCQLCHQLNAVPAPFAGNIGPDLSGVGQRLSAAALRERIIDPTRSNPDTVMPAYHRWHDLQQVEQRYAGKPILSAQEVEDLVAFLQNPEPTTP